MLSGPHNGSYFISYKTNGKNDGDGTMYRYTGSHTTTATLYSSLSNCRGTSLSMLSK